MVSPREGWHTAIPLYSIYKIVYNSGILTRPSHTKGDLTYEKCHPWSRLCSGSYPRYGAAQRHYPDNERIVNPDSEYLKELPSHIRSFEQAVAYWPNQVYIGNKTPDELAAVAQPWCDKECDCHERYGKVQAR